MQFTGMASIHPGRTRVCPTASRLQYRPSILRSPGMGSLCMIDGGISGPDWTPV
jgi:hypothetical protein